MAADGFYECQQAGRTKQPYFIERPDGEPFASGGEARSTNQRMEIRAALEAMRSLPGSLTVVSD